MSFYIGRNIKIDREVEREKANVFTKHFYYFMYVGVFDLIEFSLFYLHRAFREPLAYQM